MSGIWYGDPASIRASAAQLRAAAEGVAANAKQLDRLSAAAELTGPYAEALRQQVIQDRVDALRLAVELGEQAVSLQRQASKVEDQIAQAALDLYGN